ncbi:hypothetical protein AMJ85_10725 [candidate division BRC1 bacterium SM23_51]|nr:MAG: hypothetical protein AMJ85_10725 [candidate division BRC1 bacterium SM23_51]
MGQVHIEFTSDHQKVLQGLARSNEKLERQVAKLRQVDRTGRSAGDSLKKAFAGALPGLLSAASATTAIATEMSRIERQAEAAAMRLRDMEEALKNLYQMSGGDVELSKKYEDLAKRIMAKTGIPEPVALDAVMKGLSLRMTETDIEDLARAKFFEAHPEAFIEGVGDIRAVFGRQIADLQARQLVNMALEAQRESKLGAARMMQLATSPGQLAKMIGGTVEETFGAAGLATTGAETPERGVTQLKGFLQKLSADKEKRFLDLGLVAAMERFRALPEREREGIIGQEREALLYASRIMEDEYFAQVQQMIAQVTAAGAAPFGEGRFGKLVKGAERHPRIAAQMYEARQKAQLELTLEQEGIREQIQEGMIADVRRRAEGVNLVKRGALGLYMQLLDWLQADPERIAREAAGILSLRNPRLGVESVTAERERIYQELMAPVPPVEDRSREIVDLLREIRNEVKLPRQPVIVLEPMD